MIRTTAPDPWVIGPGTLSLPFFSKENIFTLESPSKPGNPVRPQPKKQFVSWSLQEAWKTALMQKMALFSSRVLALLSFHLPCVAMAPEQRGLFSAAPFTLPQFPCAGIVTFGVQGGMWCCLKLLSDLIQTIICSCLKRISLSSTRIVFISEFLAPLVPRIYCWFK